MSSDKIYLNRDEQVFLTEMLEINSVEDAVDKFANLLVLEGADPTKLKKYIAAIMKRMK